MRALLIPSLLAAALAAACSSPDARDGGADAVTDVSPPRDTAADAPASDARADAAPIDAAAPDTAPPQDSSAPDTSTPDTSTPDTSTPDAPTPEAPTPDAPAPDAPTPDAPATDAAPPSDVPVTDAGPAPDASPADAGPACEYFESPTTLVSCSGSWQTVFEWLATGGPTPACPTYYTAGPTRAPTIDALLTTLGCRSACVYTATAAVMFLNCGRRDEYTQFRSSDPACNPVLQFSDGSVYGSLEEFRAAHPCM